MTAIRRIASLRFPAIALAVTTLLGMLALAACDTGLDMSNDNLPAPAISQGAAVGVCGAPAGAASVVLSDLGTSIIQNAPNQDPANRLHVVGTTTGLDPATHSVYLLLVSISTNCPAYDQRVAILNADGTFSGDLELQDGVTSMRAVAVAAPTGTSVSCASTDACVAATGYVAASNTLEISL